MNKFIFENSTKVYFGKGCVKEYLESVIGRENQNILLAYGGGSIKKMAFMRKLWESCRVQIRMLRSF